LSTCRSVQNVWKWIVQQWLVFVYNLFDLAGFEGLTCLGA